ncbi:hypothetical protein Fmac_001775 [Flemingia macrophylla]|uniref:Disease resistance protein At4g27190-like leucine-rich repeats domain-containing protein n=1 Tax=Flemingia macrophylla TaxID=520843 RepID=A0ABD1NI21_9FABA
MAIREVLLNHLQLTECPMMKTFSESHPIAPKLQNILVEEEEGGKWHWEGDLNSTIQQGFNDKDRCDTLVRVIPSHLIPCFENLEVLEVLNYSKAQIIFNINEIKNTKSLGVTRLKTLCLSDLPELQHVWNKSPEGIINLQALEDMSVVNCGCLESLFPATVAKDLKCILEVLKVSKCKALVEIFSKDEKGTEEATKEFVFGRMTTLTLIEFSEFKYFYPGSHTLEWPLLEELYAFDCELVKLIFQEDHPQEQVLIQIGECSCERINVHHNLALSSHWTILQVSKEIDDVE